MQLHKILSITLIASAGLLANAVTQADTSSNQQNQPSASQQQPMQQQSMQQQPTLKQSVAKVKDKCGSEIDKLCKGVTPGEGRIAACLDSKQNQLSDSCKTAWVGAKENISKRMDRAEIQFRKDCGADVQNFCSDVPSGKGRLLSCLNNHEADLSNSCKNFQAKLQQKLDQFMS